MAQTLDIAVLVSAGRHPQSGTPRACRNDAIAMAFGKKLAPQSLRVLHVGEASDPALADYLAYGADRIDVLAGSSATTLSLLAAALKDTDLILTGCRAETGAGSGLMPYRLAEIMQRPLVADVLSVTANGAKIEACQFLPKGRRRNFAAPLPAVLTIHPLAPVALTYAHARKLTGQIIEHRTSTNTTTSTCVAAPSPVVMTPAGRALTRLKADEKRSAHQRMRAAVAAESKGGTVVDDGSDVEKAQAILAYLRQHRLVDF